MASLAYQSYDEAARAYLVMFRALRDAPPAPAAIATRGAGDVAAETLIERADQIADVSANMAPLARDYLEAPDPALREGISGQLLAQAAAELQVAIELLGIAEPPTPVTRAARGGALRDSIDALEKAMAAPVSAGLVPSGAARRGVTAADTPEQARDALRRAASVTAGAISQRVVELGGDLAFNLVFNTEWAAVIESAGLVSKDVAALLDKLRDGASVLVDRAVRAAIKTVLNVYDKMLALLGEDVTDQARARIREWLGSIRESGKIELFEQLVGRLYRVRDLEEALPGWLATSTAGVAAITAATADVSALCDKFTVFAARINTAGDVIGLARLIQAQVPQVLVVATGIRLALLAVLVYAGYDYIGYKQVRQLSLTKGVAEVIRDNLGVTA